MTLAAQIGWKLAALTAGVGLVAGTGIWGIVRARQDADFVGREFHKLQMLNAVAVRYHSADAHVDSPNERADVPEARAQLAEALKLLADFRALCGDRRHYAAAMALQDTHAAAMAVNLGNADTVLGGKGAATQPTARATATAYIAGAQRFLNRLIRDSRQLVVRSQQRTADRTRAARVVVVALSAAVIAVVLAISVWQYQAVTRPLRRLRAGVQRIASGDFAHRLDATGCTEFVEVSTAFNQTAGELRDLYADLEERIRVKSKQLARSERLAGVGFLAAAVSHEINNPLGIIAGYAESGLRIGSEDADKPLAPEVTEALEIIRDEAFRCKKITKQLLSLSRVSDEPLEVVSVAKVVGEVVDMLCGLDKYAERTMDVRWSGAEGLVVVGSALELKQAVLNITVNALDAVPSGSGVVTFDGRCTDGNVELTITDNGRGMTPEVLDKVFEPFFSDRRSQQGEGVGLGMSITQAIVERHGGSIGAESAGPGMGSTIKILLPAHTAVPAESAT